MTDPAKAPEAPDVVDTVRFLRRFADLMSNGQNSAWLLHAAILLENLSVRVVTSTGEGQLWHDKYQALAQDHERLEDECEALRNDIEGHLDLSRSLLGDREAIAETLQAHEAGLGTANEALTGLREQLAAEAQAHEQALEELRQGFDREREALGATIATRDEELGQLRETLDGERDQSAQKRQALEAKLAELQLNAEREREELQSRLSSSESLIAVLRTDAERDSEWMKARISALETQRVELRAALDRISDLQTQAASPDHPAPAHSIAAAYPAPDGDSAVVPIATLRHARAQFEYLAKESIRRGDVATQVMCELSAHTLERVLLQASRAEHSSAGEIALSILEP
jgi:DNA repair exonuclease SbcCD ATPase subunit